MQNQVMKHLEMLGKKCRDRVTGTAGIVSSISFDLYGCIQASIAGPVKPDGELARCDLAPLPC